MINFGSRRLSLPLRSGLFVLLLIATDLAQALLPMNTSGNLFVSMWNADEIAIFTPEGTQVKRFTANGLDGPRGLAFNPLNGNLWVAGEFSNALFVFDSEQNFLRQIDHPEFDEPVGVSFAMAPGLGAGEQEVIVSNSNGNELMVFSQDGSFKRRFTEPNLIDPNCTAFMPDGSLFVANRLGGSSGGVGSVTRFDNNEMFEFDFSATGITSLMAIARDPNTLPSDLDDTIWVTSGGGDTGIYEFDPSGNLLTTLLPANIGDGRPVTPQGIAFDDTGDFYVVSLTNEVIKFDGDGEFLMRFPTGTGSSRSTAFQFCPDGCSLPTDGYTDSDVIVSSGDGGGSGAISVYVLLALSLYSFAQQRPNRHSITAIQPRKGV